MGYTLYQSLADPLTAGQVVHDQLTVTSFDGTASSAIDVAITGSNDTATITASASEDTAAVDAGGAANAVPGDPSASGQLTVHDVDSGENHFQTPGSLAGSYGSFSFNPTTGVWGYTLDQSLADPLDRRPGGARPADQTSCAADPACANMFPRQRGVGSTCAEPR